jgi:hypothetical protein
MIKRTREVLSNPVDALVADVASYLPPDDKPHTALATLAALARGAMHPRELEQELNVISAQNEALLSRAVEWQQRALFAEQEVEKWKGAMKTLYEALTLSGQGIPEGIEFPDK